MQMNLVIALSLGLAACAGTAPLLTDQPRTPTAEADLNREPAGPFRGAMIQGGSEEELREFAARALTYSYPGAPEGETLILVGSLPEDLPVSLHLPEGARIVGSVTRPGEGGTEIILDFPMTPEAVITYFDDQLSKAGWEEFEETQVGAGFVPASWPSVTFCLEKDHGTLFLSTVPLTEETTDVRIQLQIPAQYSPCDQVSDEPLDQGMQLIPALISPPDSSTQGGGVSSSGDSAEVTTALRTKLSAVELAGHYAGQLSGAGWELIEEGKAARVAWSVWTITDDRDKLWNGLFLALESPLIPDGRSLWFQIQRSD